MNDVTTELFRLIIALASLLITAFLVPWLKARIDDEKLQQLMLWINKAVLSAQQLYWDKDGSYRKQVALAMINEALKNTNTTITDQQLEILIESAVKEMNIASGKTYLKETEDVKKNS